MSEASACTPYVLAGNIDQTYGGIQVLMDGGAKWHIQDYTSKWQFAAVDTETIGCNPRDESPVHRARVHAWSLAYFEDNPPLGMKGIPLARRVFFYGPPQGYAKEMLEDGRIGFGVHQGHYEYHSFANEGIRFRPRIDSLRLSRLLNPHFKQHGLKHLMLEHCGYELGDYDAVFSKEKYGVNGNLLKTRDKLPLNEIAPFTPKFIQYGDYASLDAKGTAEVIVKLAARVAARQTYKLPTYVQYYYGIEPGWLAVLRGLIGSVRELFDGDGA